MKRTALILSVMAGFALAGVAEAENSVTLYGTVDSGYGFSQRKIHKDGLDYEATASGEHDSYLAGSNLGFRGVEDLGGGLHATFVLEAGIAASTGTSVAPERLFHRESHVGLSSDDWGSLQMGRQYNLSDTFFSINSTTSMGDIDKTFGAASVRVNNMFRYLTPNLSGFQAGVGYAANGAIVRDDAAPDRNSDRNSYFSAGLQYTSGPIHAVTTYDRQGDEHAAHAATSWALLGSYDFGIARVALGYGQDRYAKINGVGAFSDDTLFGQVFERAGAGKVSYDHYLMEHDFKASNYYVGLSVPMGGGTAGFAWARTASNLDDADKLGDYAQDQTIYSARYVYPLSKRTSVYVYGSYGTGIAYIDGLDASEAGLGVYVTF